MQINGCSEADIYRAAAQTHYDYRVLYLKNIWYA